MTAAELWDKAMIEESQRQAAGTMGGGPTIDDRPRNSRYGTVVAITPTVTIGKGGMYPHPGVDDE